MGAILIQLTAGFIFAISSIGKLSNPGRFVAAVRDYELLPSRLVAPAAAFLMVIEVLVAAFLLAGVQVFIGLVVSAALCVLFAGVTAFMMVRRKRVSCGCLGVVASLRLGWPAVILNLLIAGSLVVAMPFSFRAYELAPMDHGVLWISAATIGSLYWLALYSSSVLAAVEESLEVGDLRT